MDFKRIGEVVAAIAVATAVLCLLGGLTRRRWAAGTWAILLALAVAPLAADKPLPTAQWPTVRSTDAEQRVLMSAVPLAVLAAALAARRVPWPARALLAAVAPAGVLVWVVSAYPGPPLANWPTRLGVPAAASLLAWLLVEPLAARRPTGVAAPLVCGLLTAGVGMLSLFGVYTAPGWVAVAIGGVIAGVFVVALTGRGPSFAGGPVGVVVPLLACLAAVNAVDGQEVVPPLRWGLLVAAAAAAWAVELRPMRDWRPWVRESVRAAVVVAVMAAAVVPAYRQYAKDQRDQSGESGQPNW